ncbi:MAG: hypothetical protein U0797_28180 [Gemmataceae bacterium]
MRRALGTLGLAAAFLLGSQAGCTKPAVREKPLPDPLLTSKKPIEGKPHLTDPGERDGELPPPPPMPRALPGRAPAGSVVQMLQPRDGR